MSTCSSWTPALHPNPAIPTVLQLILMCRAVPCSCQHLRSATCPHPSPPTPPNPHKDPAPTFLLPLLPISVPKSPDSLGSHSKSGCFQLPCLGPATLASAGPAHTLMSDIPTASFFMWPFSWSQTLPMNWWGTTNRRTSAPAQALSRSGSAT